MIVTRVHEQDNNANGYLVYLKWYLDSIDLSSGIHKWCLDQSTSDILQVAFMKIANIQEKVLLTNPTSGSMLENASKWYHISICGINHTRRWFHK